MGDPSPVSGLYGANKRDVCSSFWVSSDGISNSPIDDTPYIVRAQSDYRVFAEHFDKICL